MNEDEKNIYKLIEALAVQIDRRFDRLEENLEARISKLEEDSHPPQLLRLKRNGSASQ